MSPEQFRKEIEILLRAGPERWAKTSRSLSLEVQFLTRPGVLETDGSKVVADYHVLFSPTFPGWPVLADIVRHAHDLLSSQERAAKYSKDDLDPNILDAYPALEILAVIAEPEPVGWRDKWKAAGGKISRGRCVTLKTSGVLKRFSEYGHPFRPFDWGGVLDTEDIDRDEAEQLGLQ
jgi:hypothetical protein